MKQISALGRELKLSEVLYILPENACYICKLRCYTWDFDVNPSSL